LPKSQHQVTTTEHPDGCYIAPESLLIFDHLTRRIALLHVSGEDQRSQLKDKIIELLRGPIPYSDEQHAFTAPEPNITDSEYYQAVEKAKNLIREGDIYQLVLSIKFRGSCHLDPFQAYRAMRLLNPSPYMFYCDVGHFQVVGSSPEALVRLNGTQASLRPIAGTRPRGKNSQEDAVLEADLISDEKENAEHVMLVDLARNDLGRVARTGTINVHPYKSIEHYSHVMHMVSGVQGELGQDQDAFDLFAAAFPAGTLVGAPKVRAMELIDSIEPELRGIYGGTVGYFGKNGDMDQAIAIRTIVFSEGQYSFQAGGGIVADSKPDDELKEVMAKSEILRKALEMAVEGMH
ncbi:MAG TPA: anthranilate synthase component I family protein, partial [Gammaproteobacteria bacterium]|nr:anthranilate synthase component I family protein [Gammaproteobacteria bacterium]